MFVLGQEISRDQLGAAFIFCNEHNATETEQWDVVSISPDTWQIVVKTPESEEQIKERRIAELKQFLADTDYVVIKIAEGCVVPDAEGIIEQRRAARAEINEIEETLEK